MVHYDTTKDSDSDDEDDEFGLPKFSDSDEEDGEGSGEDDEGSGEDDEGSGEDDEGSEEEDEGSDEDEEGSAATSSTKEDSSKSVIENVSWSSSTSNSKSYSVSSSSSYSSSGKKHPHKKAKLHHPVLGAHDIKNHPQVPVHENIKSNPVPRQVFNKILKQQECKNININTRIIRGKVPTTEAKERVQDCLNQVRKKFFDPPEKVNIYFGKQPVLEQRIQNQFQQKCTRIPSPAARQNIKDNCPKRRISPKDWDRPWRSPQRNRKRSKGKSFAPECKLIQRKPAPPCPGKCPVNTENFCVCGADESQAVKMLPYRPTVKYCASGTGCNLECGTGPKCPGAKRPQEVCSSERLRGGQRKYRSNECSAVASRHCRFSEQVEECPISIDECCDTEEPELCRYECPRIDRGYEVKVCCCEDCGEEICNEESRYEISTQCTQAAQCPLEPEEFCDQAVPSGCCCEHGIPFSSCSTPSPPPRAAPTVIVNNTELCECEGKWEKVERWKEETRRREEDRKIRELKKERREERRKAKEKLKREIERQKDKERQRKEKYRRREEERLRREEDHERDERHMRLKEQHWLEELCDRQEERRFIEAQERRRDEQLWREEQLRTRPTDQMAVPELEEMRRALAPVPQGPHEVFEYFCCEPRVSTAERAEKAEAQAIALMGMVKEHGIHLKLSDNCPKKTTVVLTMGPPSVGNKTLNIISGAPGCCGGGGVSSEGCDNSVPQDIQNVMMKVKEMTSPLLRFNQTKPHWANLQANLGFPQGLGNTLAPYYCKF